MVLPQSESGTTAVGADVKNYIRPYYREGAVLAWWVVVVQLQGSGTTMGTCGTTAPQHGTTAGAYSTTALLEQYYRGPTQQPEPGRRESGGSSKGKGGDKKETCT